MDVWKPGGNLLLIVAASLSLLAGRCSKDPESVRIAAIQETVNGLTKCDSASNGNGVPQLAIASVSNAPNETAVRVVIYATDSPVEFLIPVYKLSAGRWLIGEKDRAFLLDEKCREYRLRDRRSVNGKDFPPDGIVRLNPGQSFETIFSFHRVKEEVRIGMLVYAGKSLPFVISQPQPAQEKQESTQQ
ncbi:MAG: hypothetical protein JNK38_02050 [Acidobacteria bacterium]|nr:hypothetical protein [Acidobacteriota bacterium]